MAAPIPLLLLSGFLGAGKTTLLNRILSGDHGQRIAVLVNDFGAVDIDRRLIAAADGESLRLSNGCICCSIGSSLMEALLKLLARPDPPERLIIEASGVADPARIGAIGMAGDAFRLEAIVTVVDAETVETRLADPQIGATVRRQIEAADLLILNKTDLVAAEGITGVWNALRSLSPAPVVPAVNAAVPDALLFDLSPVLPKALSVPAQDHAAAVRTLTMMPEGPIDRERLPALAEAIAATAWRAKGFLDIGGSVSLLQVVGRRWTCSPAPDEAPTGLVVIGPAESLRDRAVEAALRAAEIPTRHRMDPLFVSGP